MAAIGITGEARPLLLGPVGVGPGHPLAIIAGPCVLEEEERVLRIARGLARACEERGLGFIFKASFDKANRTSLDSPRGPGIAEGLRALERVRGELGCPLTTDVHLPEQAAQVAAVVDLLQVPAFLCRQTDLLLACAATGRAVNVKKGQFLAPEDMAHPLEKLRRGGASGVLLTERGVSFGYHQLVVDMSGLPRMRALGAPVCFDATHSVQRPGGAGATTGGDRAMVPFLARAAVAVGVDAVFMEVHDDPDRAWSDGPNQLRLETVPALLDELAAIDRLVRGSA
jgi:2-dehydro-3-deoxyphosphooctonate aldolase (KDO 8-P synthase)